MLPEGQRKVQRVRVQKRAMPLPNYPSARRFSKILGAMEPFRVLEHTADVGFEAFGRTREEVFANAGRALMNIIVDLESVDPAAGVRVQAEGSDPPDLLVNWLSEILYLYDAEGWVFRGPWPLVPDPRECRRGPLPGPRNQAGRFRLAAGRRPRSGGRPRFRPRGDGGLHHYAGRRRGGRYHEQP